MRAKERKKVREREREKERKKEKGRKRERESESNERTSQNSSALVAKNSRREHCPDLSLITFAVYELIAR